MAGAGLPAGRCRCQCQDPQDSRHACGRDATGLQPVARARCQPAARCGAQRDRADPVGPAGCATAAAVASGAVAGRARPVAACGARRCRAAAPAGDCRRQRRAGPALSARRACRLGAAGQLAGGHAGRCAAFALAARHRGGMALAQCPAGAGDGLGRSRWAVAGGCADTPPAQPRRDAAARATGYVGRAIARCRSARPRTRVALGRTAAAAATAGAAGCRFPHPPARRPAAAGRQNACAAPRESGRGYARTLAKTVWASSASVVVAAIIARTDCSAATVR